MTQQIITRAKAEPNATNLEMAVLGALMLDKNAILIVSNILKVGHFYLDKNNNIYSAMLSLFERNAPIDLMTVTEELKNKGFLGLAAGQADPAYLADMTNRVASAANIEYHSRIILQKFLRRVVLQVTMEFHEMAKDDTIDVFELLHKFEKAIFNIQDHFLSQKVVSIASVSAMLMKEVIDGDEGDLVGVPTFYQSVDEIAYSYKPGDLVIEAARPGMGKTAYLIGKAIRQAQNGFNVAIFSLEMTAQQLASRMVSCESEINGYKISNRLLEEDEKDLFAQNAQRVGELPIWIDDTGGVHVHDLAAKCRRLKKFNDIDIVYIDYLTLLNATGAPNVYNSEQEIAYISKYLKTMAKELEIPVVALSQLSRAVEMRGGAKRPQLSDLRQSGQIEQDADMVKFLYRPEYYEILEDEEGQSLKGIAEIIIAKNRHGALGSPRLKFIPEYTKFKDLEDPDFSELPFTPSYPNIITRPSKMNDDEDIPY